VVPNLRFTTRYSPVHRWALDSEGSAESYDPDPSQPDGITSSTTCRRQPGDQLLITCVKYSPGGQPADIGHLNFSLAQPGVLLLVRCLSAWCMLPAWFAIPGFGVNLLRTWCWAGPGQPSHALLWHTGSGDACGLGATCIVAEVVIARRALRNVYRCNITVREACN